MYYLLFAECPGGCLCHPGKGKDVNRLAECTVVVASLRHAQQGGPSANTLIWQACKAGIGLYNNKKAPGKAGGLI